MKENGRLDDLLHRYRGMGLVMLCAVMLVFGSLQMDKRTVETGSREIVRESSEMAADTKTGKMPNKLSVIVPAGERKVQAILGILKKYHTDLQVILEEESKEGQFIKWCIEYQE